MHIEPGDSAVRSCCALGRVHCSDKNSSINSRNSSSAHSACREASATLAVLARARASAASMSAFTWLTTNCGQEMGWKAGLTMHVYCVFGRFHVL